MAKQSEQPANDQEPASEEPEGFSAGDLGKIQGILFGEQARKTDQRLANIESDLQTAVSDLESRSNTVADALRSDLAAETATREAAVAKLLQTTKDLAKANTTEQKAREKADTALGDKLDATTASLTTSIDEVQAAAAAALEERSRSDRASLAAMLRSIADQLDGSK